MMCSSELNSCSVPHTHTHAAIYAIKNILSMNSKAGVVWRIVITLVNHAKFMLAIVASCRVVSICGAADL